MAHFVKLDENNVVRRGVVVNNETADTDEAGQAFLRNLYNEPDAIWKKTSYNTHQNMHKLGGTPFRKNYACIGYTYDPVLDAFIEPKSPTNPSYVLNTEKGIYEPPIPMPPQQENGDGWVWDEGTISWVSRAKEVLI